MQGMSENKLERVEQVAAQKVAIATLYEALVEMARKLDRDLQRIEHGGPHRMRVGL
jgi:hypothetical protein